MSHYDYRITVNDAIGGITSVYPGDAQWELIGQACEDRDWTATLDRRLVVDEDAAEFLSGLTDTAGYIRIGGLIICPWEILAEMKPRSATIVLTGGS